jgi:hypothetical protein
MLNKFFWLTIRGVSYPIMALSIILDAIWNAEENGEHRKYSREEMKKVQKILNDVKHPRIKNA